MKLARPVRTAALMLAAPLTLASFAARAELVDEIQVYTDEINQPGEFGLELHTNFAPSGRSVPDYKDEITPDRTLYATAELSWGLSKTLEAGLYIPTARDGANGNFAFAGLKGRLKWLPIQDDPVNGGWYGGANFEIGRVDHVFNNIQNNAELRFMAGWRNHDWLIGINPTLGWELSNGGSAGTGYSFSVKGTHRVAEGIGLGLEYYSEQGDIGHTLPWQLQDNKLFFVMDFDRGSWVFNVGIGAGLTDATANTTIKAIFEVPI